MLNRKTEASQQDGASSSIQEAKNSAQPLNIEGLPKERVLITLFDNVYKKSKASYSTWMSIADRCYFDGAKAPVGMDFSPSEYEARQVLSQNKYGGSRNV